MGASRYSCQMALPGFGEVAQQLLRDARVLIAGAGGLGCPVAQYLAAAGAGTIGIADSDVVSVSNLHRQILYTPADAGLSKAITACSKLKAQNPDVQLVAHQLMLDAENIMGIINDYELVIDCTDNFDSRYLINDACVLAGKPLVYGAIYRYEGQVAVWNIQRADGSSPNYRDAFPDVNAAAIPNCADGGVLPTLAGIIGCMMANEAIKLITHTGEILAGRLLMFDAATAQSHTISIGTLTKTNITSLPQLQNVPFITYHVLRLSPGSYELIDVRTAAERQQSHIGGRHIPMDELVSNPSLGLSDKPIVLYCASGRRSAMAAKLMKKHFPTITIYTLKGGIQAVLA